MSVILCSSLLLRILTALWSLMVLFWFRDRRILLLTAMLILMAIRQGLTLAAEVSSSATMLDLTAHPEELPGLIVSVMAFLFVLSLGGLLPRLCFWSPVAGQSFRLLGAGNWADRPRGDCGLVAISFRIQPRRCSTGCCRSEPFSGPDRLRHCDWRSQSGRCCGQERCSGSSAIPGGWRWVGLFSVD